MECRATCMDVRVIPQTPRRLCARLRLPRSSVLKQRCAAATNTSSHGFGPEAQEGAIGVPDDPADGSGRDRVDEIGNGESAATSCTCSPMFGNVYSLKTPQIALSNGTHRSRKYRLEKILRRFRRILRADPGGIVGISGL